MISTMRSIFDPEAGSSDRIFLVLLSPSMKILNYYTYIIVCHDIFLSYSLLLTFS
jgi:hypothetical protein